MKLNLGNDLSEPFVDSGYLVHDLKFEEKDVISYFPDHQLREVLVESLKQKIPQSGIHSSIVSKSSESTCSGWSGMLPEQGNANLLFFV
jgi:hypothetical protein